MKKIFYSFTIVIMLLYSCEKDPASSGSGENKITFSATYISEVLTKPAIDYTINSPELSEIKVTRARFLVRNVKLRSVSEDSIEFVSDPYVIELYLDGQPNTINVKEVPADTYDRVDFRIHRLDDDDPKDLAYFRHPDFQDFVADNRYSMIIEGLIKESDNLEHSFIFRSRDSEKQRHFLEPPLTADDLRDIGIACGLELLPYASVPQDHDLEIVDLPQ